MNIAFSILVKPLGMVTFVKTVHSPNAELPILVTALGIVMFVKLVHPKNAPLLNLVRTPYSITTQTIFAFIFYCLSWWLL